MNMRPVSVTLDPALPIPPVHPRKGERQGKNPFLFAMLFEKNIEIFSDPNPSVLCVFSICLPPFRAWTGVTSEKVGSWQTDTGRALTGKIDLDICSYVWESSGVLSGLGASDGINPQQGAMNGQQTAFDFDASRSWGDTHTGTEFAPAHVYISVIVYLGVPS